MATPWTYFLHLSLSSVILKRRYWTECTEYVWRSGKLVNGQRNGRSPRSSHFIRNAVLNGALVSHASKILLRIILKKIRVKTETETADEQAGFRQGMGTRDQITNLRILMHKAREHQQLLYNRIMCFVDFKKAFDSTNKISSKQPKSYLLLTFRPLSEAFIRRSWY